MKRLLSKKKNVFLFRGLTATLACLLAVLLCMTQLLWDWEGNVNMVLGVEVPTTSSGGEMVYGTEYTVDGFLNEEGLKSMLEASDAHDIQTMEEGAVLVKNADCALPLKQEEKKITLFGKAVTDPVYRNRSGGSKAEGERMVSLYEALSNSGYTVNDSVYEALLASDVKRVSGDGIIGEVPVSLYSGYESTWKDQVAAVMFSRAGSEGKDLGMTGYGKDGTQSQLALQPEEADLLEMLKSEKDAGNLRKVIVLINSSYAMELGWLEEEQYGVDAALWIGGPAMNGFTGVVNILKGQADPSGHFVDTYATNSLSSPATVNASEQGTFQYANYDGYYIVEAEGIYNGYKYYETRYYDQILGLHNATTELGSSTGNAWNYADEMTYPFGYGQSYAQFEQTLKSLVWDRENHVVTAEVEVENLGSQDDSYTGKSKAVVQLYVSLPYSEGQAEKSAIQLLDFGKTGLLEKGEKETVTIEVSDYLFATYDSNAVNGADTEKKGCYVFDPGDYFFTVGTDAHAALNNVLAAQGVEEGLVDLAGQEVSGKSDLTKTVTLTELDNTSYATSRFNDTVVSNRFEDIDLNFFDEGKVTYLTRSDWNTFPVAYNNITVTEEMRKQLDGKYVKQAETQGYKSVSYGENRGLSFYSMKNAEFDDPRWEDFLSQLSLNDMVTIIGENFAQAAIEGIINKPANKNTDGPSGSQNNYLSEYGGGQATCHVDEVVAASTWNKEILSDRGHFIAEDALYSGTSQLWCPGANLHRTPFSGRNFEYYSEDSIMSYLCGAAQCEAMQAQGVCASIKHFCANDQETHRGSLSMFMTEQAYRQGPLKGFEGAFTEGGALSCMMSCGRIGCKMMYHSAETLTEVMRGEWDYKGMTITDAVKGNNDMDAATSIVSGTDVFNNGVDKASELKTQIVSSDDGYLLENARTACKRYFYTYARTNLVNGLSEKFVAESFIPWWKKTVTAVNFGLSVLTVISATLYLAASMMARREKKHEK